MADFAIVTFCLSTATTWNRTRSTPIPSFHHRCVPPFSSAAGVGATRPAAVTLAVAVGHGAVRCTAATPGFDVFAPSDTPAITSAASGSAHDQLSNPLSTKPTSRIADRYATLTRHEPVTASMRVTRPSAVSTGLPRAMPVRALPAASATITRKVSAVQMDAQHRRGGPPASGEGVADLGDQVDHQQHEPELDQPHGSVFGDRVTGVSELPEHHDGRADLDQ